ncbi:MAG: hypothetical protein LBL13_12475 [Bacteroidales bacterium]|nr:hypothetical protein [Bacteroidales bacterium]
MGKEFLYRIRFVESKSEIKWLKFFVRREEMSDFEPQKNKVMRRNEKTGNKTYCFGQKWLL